MDFHEERLLELIIKFGNEARSQKNHGEPLDNDIIKDDFIKFYGDSIKAITKEYTKVVNKLAV
jgi:hypothetical protein